jgi:hypothetical protein
LFHHVPQQRAEPAPSANTGNPAAPSARYTTWLRNPRRHPSTAPLKSTAKVWPVMGTGEIGKWKLNCAQAAVTKLKAITQAASVARFRAPGTRSIRTSVEARVIMLLENSLSLTNGIALPKAIGIIT